MSRYSGIDYCNMDNGRGIRIAIWLQGCPHHCKGCFNPHTWSPSHGDEIDEALLGQIRVTLREDYIQGVTLLGGEPLAKYNIDTSNTIAIMTKELGKDVWCYTGYSYEEVEGFKILNYIDVLIDGRFEQDKFDPLLKWRGSSNQNIINVPMTCKLNKYNLSGDTKLVLDKDN